MSGDKKLRAELQKLTKPPEDADLTWLDRQIHEMTVLNTRMPHSVRLHERYSAATSKANCFMFALDIKAHAVSDKTKGHIFPGKTFVVFLLASGDLREAEDGPLVIYFRGGVPAHAGTRDGNDVVSKWGLATPTSGGMRYGTSRHILW